MLLGTFLIVSTAFAAAIPYAANQTIESCYYLYREYPYAVHFPGSSEYEYQNTVSWSTDSWMGPACVFTPSTPAMISTGIELLAAREVPFAIRGGGWMPVSNAANIGDNGVLFSNTNITSITVSENKTSVTLGAGVKFAALYKELESYNLGINGIRQGDIGVTGFHIGGGIGFYAWELGLSASTVNWFECVLGNSTVVRASATENTDLFWALKGGGNNFCYITALNVPTFPSTSVALGDIAFGSEVYDRYAQSVTDFALYGGTDPKSSMEGQTRWNPARNPNVTYHAYLFNSEDNAAAPGLANFSAPVMHAVTGNVTSHTMNTWFNNFQTGGDKTNRKRFIFHTLPANVEAYKIAQTTYYETVRELEDVRGFFTAFSVMPATLHMLEATTAAGGSAIDFAKEPQLWIVLSPSWKDGEDDLRVDGIHAKANEAIAANLKAAGYSLLPFVYLNDSAKGQAVFEGYGQTNWDRLKAIAQQYDPAAVFQNLVTGACKVTAARGESS